MITVRHILESKGGQIWSVSPDTTVYDALKLMAEKNLGAVLVQKGDTLLGIFSERDYARKIILKGKSSKETTVDEIMTPDVVTVQLKNSIEECMGLMTNNRIRHLPVVENAKIVGVVSIGDIVKAIISEQEYTIKQLESYITGTR
ncbi:MAG: CBS domain-containing protein [Ignavibacteriales bacterium]|nr:CBS domain-containing protein [Ignavibacteriales bacterium]